MMVVPWWLMSPSIFTIIQGAILTLVGFYWLRKGPYKSRLTSLIQSAFTFMFIMTLFDTFYVAFIILRFLPSHPQETFTIFASLGRDIVATILFYYMPWKLWQVRCLKWNLWSALMIYFNIVFLAFWIGYAPNLNWVNAQQAYMNQPEILWKTIFLGHFLGRILNTSFWISLWRHN